MHWTRSKRLKTLYSFVEITDADKYDGKYFGTDAITVGMLYRGGKVTLAGAAKLSILLSNMPVLAAWLVLKMAKLRQIQVTMLTNVTA